MNARRTFAAALGTELGPDAVVYPAPTNAATAPCWIIEPDVPYITPGSYCSAVRRLRLLAVVARTDAEANMDAIDAIADLTVEAVLKLEAGGLIDGTTAVAYQAVSSVDNLQIGETAYVAAVVNLTLHT
jgi:hypothetical protein